MFVSHGKTCRDWYRHGFLFSTLLLVMSGCGWEADNAMNGHAKVSSVFKNVSSVVSGTVTSPVALSSVSFENRDTSAISLNMLIDMPVAAHADNGKFFFTNLAASSKGKPLVAKLTNGEKLYSFWYGVSISHADIAITDYKDWEGKTYVDIGITQSNLSTVNINQLTNLAYRVFKRTSSQDFASALDAVNQFLQSNFQSYSLSPQNFVQEPLSDNHLKLLNDYSFTAYTSSFRVYRKDTNTVLCAGELRTFPACQ